MTMQPIQEEALSSEKSKKEFFGNPALEDIFLLGYTTSDPIVIFKDESKDIEIKVRFRTLTPIELRKVYEATTQFSSFGGKGITEKLETLCFAVMTVNDSPLVMSTGERETYKEEYGTEPGPLDQARYIIVNKIKSIFLIDAIYDAYTEFSDKIKEEFDDIKKKLKNPKSSSLNSDS